MCIGLFLQCVHSFPFFFFFSFLAVKKKCSSKQRCRLFCTVYKKFVGCLVLPVFNYGSQTDCAAADFVCFCNRRALILCRCSSLSILALRNTFFSPLVHFFHSLSWVMKVSLAVFPWPHLATNLLDVSYLLSSIGSLFLT